ncbi:MAG TPA: serine/threonine-protein kinase [Gemmatimonadaceae bacterium]|nr:serine/threonine-protein kinase [Gemmatimonadaceae bacterium]
MELDHWKKVERIMDVVLESDPSHWGRILDEESQGDVALRQEVASLLNRYEAARFFLESPPAEAAAALVAEAREPAQEVEHRRIGAYRLVKQIGRGGMSRVFLAERADGAFEQQVAIKLLRPGLDSDIDHNRFRAERQILATLNHPNIARLLDGGIAADGTPYLVLEYVDGEPIDAYCDAHALGVRQRLELFASVADATEAAHQSLVVHRDLKPSNILITKDGVVKLLDFGLAKLLEPVSTVAALSTHPGHRWLTPEYAAPEQITGGAITTLTDVYQLGAVLYELLTGRPPLGNRDRNVHELEAAVVRDDPTPPSAVAPESRRRALRGDIDAIVLKALSKEPDQRYASPRALIDELRRHLAGHPVLARRQTLGYRTRRFARRHRSGLAVAAIVVMLLATYVATVATDRRRIHRALDEATAGTHRAEQVTDFMLGLFDASAAGQSLGDTVKARALLERGLARAHELRAQPALQAQMLDVVGRLEINLGEYDRARPVLEEALALRRKVDGAVHPDVATSLESLAWLEYDQGNYAEAAKLRGEVLTMRRRLFGDSDTKTTTALLELASAMHAQGDFRNAQPLLDKWVAIVSRQRPETTDLRARQLKDLAAVYGVRENFDIAVRLSREAADINRTLYGERHANYANALVDLAWDVANTGKLAEADSLLRYSVEVLREVYPAGHPDLLAAVRSLGSILDRQHRYAEAEAPLREAVALARRFDGPDSPRVTDGELDLSIALTMTGRYDESLEVARDAERILRLKYPATNRLVLRADIDVAEALRGKGRYAQAESLLLPAFKAFENGRGFSNRPRAHAVDALVRLYQAQGRTADAAKYEALRRR